MIIPFSTRDFATLLASSSENFKVSAIFSGCFLPFSTINRNAFDSSCDSFNSDVRNSSTLLILTDND